MNVSHQWDKYLLLTHPKYLFLLWEYLLHSCSNACVYLFHMGGICEPNLFSIKSNVFIDWDDVNIHACKLKRFWCNGSVLIGWEGCWDMIEFIEYFYLVLIDFGKVIAKGG